MTTATAPTPSTIAHDGGSTPQDAASALSTRLESCVSLVSLASSCETALADAQPSRPAVRVTAYAQSNDLGEIRAECVRRGQDRSYLHDVLDVRCKQLFPKDLLVAEVPTKKGGWRPVGFLRRSLRFDKKNKCRVVVIDLVYVLKSHRGLGLGRSLLEEGMVSGRKPKPCSLLVAGSEENKVAVRLYESLGFAWDNDLHAEMKAPASAVAALMERREVQAEPAAVTRSASRAWSSEASEAGTDVAHAVDVVSPPPSPAPP